MKKKVLLFIAFVSILLFLLLIPKPYLILQDFYTKEVYYQIPIDKSDKFTVEWIHSVELTPWRETYVGRYPKGIELIETSFQSYGVGVPANTGQKTQIMDGWIVVTGISDKRDSVVYLISRPDYKLILDDRSLFLKQIVPKDASVEFTIKWKI